MLRGVGETPIMPLGISYLDDFSREENAPFYLGLCLCICSLWLFWFFFFWGNADSSSWSCLRLSHRLCLLPACIHAVGILGPMIGFMLGSFLSKIYVDIGFVDLGTTEMIFILIWIVQLVKETCQTGVISHITEGT